VLDEDAEEALDAAQQGAVNHVRAVGPAVFADELHGELFGQVEVELDGTGLPVPAEGVLDVDVDLGPVEGAAAGIDPVRNAEILQGLFQRGGGLLPPLRLPYCVLRAGGEKRGNVTEPEDPPDVQGELQGGADFLPDLVGRADDVGIVLGEAAHAEQAMQDAGLFVAVHGAQFGPPERQLPVGAQGALVNQDVERAVHGLYEVLVLVDPDRGIHAGTIEIEVPGGLPQQGTPDMRRVDEFVSAAEMLAPPEVLNEIADHGGFGMPQDQSGPDRFVSGEQVQLPPEAAVIAELGLFPALKEGLEFLAGREAGAVDTLQHGVGFPAAVVGAGYGEEFEYADMGCAGHMGSAAEVHEVTAAVEGYVLAFGNIGQAFQLVVLSVTAEPVGSFFAGHNNFFKWQVGFLDAAHLGFDAREVFRSEPVGQVKVVVEAVLGRRPDIQLHLIEEAADRGCHHVRRTVAHGVQIRLFLHAARFAPAAARMSRPPCSDGGR